ncbi:MAG: hypothetical protein JRJ85_04080 [Deltaproteobacteria bacterium]|nr:hypothetical protein [Deltaproteobacteria bacterium]
MEVRRLTEKGIEAFRKYLSKLRSGSTVDPPDGLLADSDASAPVPGNAEVVKRTFATRLDMAGYLDEALSGLKIDGIETDVGLWSWLSIVYFDQVCPRRKDGTIRPGRDYRHLLEPNYRRWHRHLLAGAYMSYSVYGLGENLGKLILYSPPSVESRFYHELASRQNLITNPGVMEAVNLLYFHEKEKKPKPAALSQKQKPGTFFRFIDVIQQLDLTYDLYSMTGEEVLELLPFEFDRWRPS